MTMATFVYGSCVARDTFETFPGGAATLKRYVARQSLLSATSPPRTAPALDDAGLSAFQQRMVTGDWESSLWASLDEAGPIDLFLWDLTDERLGVYEFPDGSIVTRSVELISSGREGALTTGAQFHALGSASHRRLWKQRLPAFLDRLQGYPIRRPLVLIAAPWATHFDSGDPTPTSFGIDANSANTEYAPYYDDISSAEGVRVVARAIPKSSPQRGGLVTTAQADPNHQWGPAPFHYTSSTYTSIRTAVLAASDGLA